MSCDEFDTWNHYFRFKAEQEEKEMKKAKRKAGR